MVAAQRDLWRPTEVLAAFREVGFNPSLSKVAAMWGGTSISVRLDDLDKICAALDRTPGDLLQAEPLDAAQAPPEYGQRAVGAEETRPGPVRPTPRSGRRSGPRSLPPN